MFRDNGCSEHPVVLGMGDPVMDVLMHVNYDFLHTVAQKAGGCVPITYDELGHLTALGAKECEPVRVPGGSAANVMKGLANISAGQALCKFMGMVGQDTTAADYKEKLQQQGVQPVLLETEQGPTASCLCFVTPDGQRTMRTCLGASAQLTSASLLPVDWCRGAVLLHCEGYCLYRPQLAQEAMLAAKAAGALVSIDLASFELVANCIDTLLRLLKQGLIDLVFANEEEAVALLKQVDAAGAAAAGTAPAGGVKVVDTIGAGDYFTSGFLYAYLMGCSLQQCAAVGCQAGSAAVQTRGAILSDAAWQQLRSTVETIVDAAPY
eukprot:gene13102-13230_t